MKIIVTLFCLFTGLATAQSQQPAYDSLSKSLSKAKDDSNKVKLYLVIAKEVVYQDARKALTYYMAGAWLAKKINYLKGAGLCYMNVANAYSFMSRVDSSLLYMDSSLTFLRQLGDPGNLSVFFANRADTYVQISDFKKALQDCDTATRYAELISDKMKLAFIYNVRADIYWHLKQYELNNEYVQKALQIHLETNNSRMVGQAYADIGDWYVQKMDPAQGISYYKKAIHIGDSLNDQSNLSRYHSLLSEAYLVHNKPLEAAVAANTALNYAITEDNPVQEASVYTLLCKIYNQQHNPAAAIQAGRLGHFIAIKEIDLPLQQSSATALAAAFKIAGNIDSAYHYLQLSKDLNDSLITKNFNQVTANLQISFDVDQKEKQIELLAKDKIIQQQELKRQQALITAAFIVAILSLVGIWLAVNRYRLRQRMKEMELRNQIAADLHDEVGSSLSSIHMLSQMATTNEIFSNQQVILDKVSANARETMDRMNDIVWMIKPGETEAGSLQQRMEKFAREICSSKNIMLQMDLSTIDKTKLTMAQRKNCYLVFKEALNNAVKYSGADRITVNARIDGNKFEWMVQDDGRGFDVTKITRGNGLDNMKSRARDIGGNLHIQSTVGEGTSIALAVYV